MDPYEPRDERNAPRPASLEQRVEGWIRVMLHEPMLRPLFAVLLGHAVAFLVPVLVLAGRERNPFAAAALALLIVGSLLRLHSDWQHYRRPGPLGGTLLAMWANAAAAAFAAAHYGIC